MLTLAIESVKQAYKEFKSFCIDDFEGDYRFAAKQALKDIIEKKDEQYSRCLPGRFEPALF